MSVIYNEIGQGYNTTRQADPEILAILTNLMSLHEHGNYLDAGCGTGNYTHELAKICGNWKAFDQSEVMIQKAKEKASPIEWSVFDVIETSYEPTSFDAILCTLAIHHFKNLGAAFKEIKRIISKNGNFVIFTSTPEQMKKYWLNHYFPEMLELSIRQMPKIQDIESALHSAGMKLVNIQPFSVSEKLADLFLYSGKHRPEIYLSQQVRAGISSFRNFCSPSELNSGISSLTEDIASGNIYRVIDEYNSDIGDYCFLVANSSEN